MEPETTGPAPDVQPRAGICQPVLSMLMDTPVVARAITAFLVFQFGLTALGFAALPCPISHVADELVRKEEHGRADDETQRRHAGQLRQHGTRH